jgi:thioredoxin 1
MAHIKHFTDSDFEAEISRASLPILVDFWAEWCIPCKHIAPIVEQMAEAYEGKLLVAKFNVDDNPKIPSTYGIVSIPTLILFKNKEVVERRVGALSKNDLKKMLDKHLANDAQ